MQERDNTQRRGPKPEWKEVARFEQDGLAVVVTSTQSFRPRYSVNVGKLRDDKTVAPHLPVHVDGTFQIKLRPLAATVNALLQQAEEWIATDAASRASDDIDRRIERETKQANFGRQETRVTGKTERKKAKRAGAAA